MLRKIPVDRRITVVRLNVDRLLEHALELFAHENWGKARLVHHFRLVQVGRRVVHVNIAVVLGRRRRAPDLQRPTTQQVIQFQLFS